MIILIIFCVLYVHFPIGMAQAFVVALEDKQSDEFLNQVIGREIFLAMFNVSRI